MDDLIQNHKLFGSPAQELSSVYVENYDFRKLIPTWDSSETLFYLDPPYLMDEKMYAFDLRNQTMRNCGRLSVA